MIIIVSFDNVSGFRQKGFCIVEKGPDCIKVVKGRCEIHIRKTKKYIVLDLPVMTLREKGASKMLLTYLLDRNGALDGPGFFAIQKNLIYYKAIAMCYDNIENLALDMQNCIEQIGPKILNVAKQ